MKSKAECNFDSRQAAFLAANQAEVKKGRFTVVLDLRDVTLLCDYFVIVGGDTQVQVKAIAEAIDQGLSQIGVAIRAIEGKAEGRWILLDYGSVIIHVMQNKERDYYKLEQFWKKGLIVDEGEWREVDGMGRQFRQSLPINR